MNLFTARLTGKMLSTERFEKHIQSTQARILRWKQIDQSSVLKEYLDLKQKIESPEFQAEKKELISRKYKDTEEGKKMLQYKALVSSRRVKWYRSALENPSFLSFLAFRETDDFAKIKSFKERMRSGELRMFYRIYRSSFYKNYLKMHNSVEIEQLAALEKEINMPDFQERHALWADKKRWQHSKAYVREMRFKELGKMNDIQFYFSQDKAQIERAERFLLTFEEKAVSGANWKPGFGYASAALKDGHSLANEKQAYNGGKNTFFVNGNMEIELREETKKAAAWDTKKGFIEKTFSYTSDVMNTKAAFAQEQGLFMVKMRSQGAGCHFLGLTSGKNGQPMVALHFYNGKKVQMGMVANGQSRLAKLSGASRSKYYVYSLRWTAEELIWYVNNLEVFRMANTLTKDQLFFLAQSFLPSTAKAGEGKMQVEWMRVYKCAE